MSWYLTSWIVSAWTHSRSATTTFVAGTPQVKWEAPSPKGVAGVLELTPAPNGLTCYHLPIQLQSGVSVWACKTGRSFHEGTTWIPVISFFLLNWYQGYNYADNKQHIHSQQNLNNRKKLRENSTRLLISLLASGLLRRCWANIFL